MGDHHAANVQADPTEGVNQAERILIIGDAQVAAALGTLNVIGGDSNDDLQLIFHLQQHFHLAVRLKTRKYA